MWLDLKRNSHFPLTESTEKLFFSISENGRTMKITFEVYSKLYIPNTIIKHLKMFKKCLTDQGFIRKRNTTYKTGTLVTNSEF